MKKVFYFIIPVVIIIVASSIFRSNSGSDSKATGSCSLSAKEYLDADKKDVITLDVRTQREYDYGHIDGAIVMDIYKSNFKSEVNKLDKNKTYYVYCKTGIRSRSAVGYMLQSGFKNVCDLSGGTNYLTRGGVKLVQ